MSAPLSTYSFLPYLRQGLANHIDGADDPARTGMRGATDVVLQISGEKVSPDVPDADDTISKTIQLYGPGDVIGIDPRAIVKTEPRNWITNFETNYLPYIEFYDEDFPWRYTPAKPDDTLHRLRPWLTLIVLKEGEFQDGQNIKDKPLPFIAVEEAASLFPAPDQLWAWAHVHVNRSLFGTGNQTRSGETNLILDNFQALLKENPDLAYSRIVCPRQLEPNQPYHAFLIPTFESGRLAGLGLDPAKSPRTMLSGWEAYPEGTKEEPAHFPYYHRWYFRSGTVGDFEYLVRLLEPKPVDARVGNRDMDARDPGQNIPGVAEALKLGGALMAPFAPAQNDQGTAFTEVVWNGYENWDEPMPQPFQVALAEFVNLADDYEKKKVDVAHQEVNNPELKEQLDKFAEGDDPDPVITPPLYGRWHALESRILYERDGAEKGNIRNWVHKLNLDPRYRVPAGLGTKVVQEKQEELMDAAWGQIGKVLEANRKIRQAQLAKEVSFVWHSRHLQPLFTAFPEKAMLLATPLQKRILVKFDDMDANAATATTNGVLTENFTVFHNVQNSVVPYSMMSAPMRRAVRPRGKFMRNFVFSNDIRPDNLLARINEGDVKPAPPKQTPAGVVTDVAVSDAAAPKGIPAWLRRWLLRYPWLRFVPLVLALIVIVLLFIFGAANPVVIGSVAVLGAGLFVLLDRWWRQAGAANLFVGSAQTPQAVDRLPRSPDFQMTEPGSAFRPKSGGNDSVEAVRFKQAAKAAFAVLEAGRKAGAPAVKNKLDLPRLANVVVASINPEKTIPRLIWNGILLPGRIGAWVKEQFKEAMAYPEFDLPMYKPLADVSSELFLPNINLIEQNSVTLLQTNQKFIESYMVGLNHEFARELLWREYPTDQRGSYFRQFWDVSSFFKPGAADPEALREELRDIPPLHQWSKFSDLGAHDHRDRGGPQEKEVVLVIRGELLKKYPTAVVYAHRAEWDRDAGGHILRDKPRLLTPLNAAEEENPPLDKVKTPLYEAKVEPDIYFFGFDLTVEEAGGDSGEDNDDRAGWFFVLKERPGEPRFGFDIEPAGALQIWNDLSWKQLKISNQHIDINTGTPENEAISLQPIAEPPQPDPGESPSEARLRWEQQQEDLHIRWNTAASQTNAAELAYIMYQVPVMVAVHAKEMLPR